jgi:hypothetical protein
MIMRGTVRRRVRRNGPQSRPIATWLADYFDDQGARHNKSFKTEREATAWLAHVRDGKSLRPKGQQAAAVFALQERLTEIEKRLGKIEAILARLEIRLWREPAVECPKIYLDAG